MASKKMPKWANSDRQAYLVKLWVEYGNQCLYGHPVCPIPEHYQYTETKGVNVSIAVKTPCQDRAGNPLKDDLGNQLFLTIYGNKTVAKPETKVARLYERKAEQVIKFWLEDDKESQQADWEAESLAIHSLGERRYTVAGRFSSISKDIYASSQPLYYFDGQAVSGLTFKPFVRVRIASSYMRLYVDLGDALRQVSKSKRRKAIRYGKPLPQEVRALINQRIMAAVRDYI